MAILMLAIPKLLDKKYGQYYLLMFAAFLFHTYAIVFAILPLFAVKPWGWRTFLLLFLVFVVVANFESVIGSFLDYASEQGKDIAEYEVFDNNKINSFCVAVYGVVPLLSLVFARYLGGKKGVPTYNLLIHMSIISFSFMLLGTINGANMFGRMANYFELGMICSLTWIIDRVFTKSSVRLITAVAIACFFGYFYYAYQINLNFDATMVLLPSSSLSNLCLFEEITMIPKKYITAGLAEEKNQNWRKNALPAGKNTAQIMRSLNGTRTISM